VTLAGVAVSQTTVLLSHTLQFAVLLALFTNLTQHTLFICWSKRSRQFAKSSHWVRFGPAYMVAAATACIMVRPTYLVMKIAKKVVPVQPPLGVSFWMHLCTVAGYVLLLAGTLWTTELWARLCSLCSERSHANRDTGV